MCIPPVLGLDNRYRQMRVYARTNDGVPRLNMVVGVADPQDDPSNAGSTAEVRTGRAQSSGVHRNEVEDGAAPFLFKFGDGMWKTCWSLPARSPASCRWPAQTPSLRGTVLAR
jgi:hypothetical protein